MGVARNFDWGACEAPQAPRGVESGEGAWGSVVSSPSGVRGGAPAANDFSTFWSLKNDAGGTSNGVFWELVEGQL